MDSKNCMIVDLDKRGDKRMFITESVASINKNRKGLWAVTFKSSQHIFSYNPSRLLYLTKPKSINLEEKGLYINNRHITNSNEVLLFTDGRHSFYHITYKNGYYENLESKYVYITRTAINDNNGSLWEYLKTLADETGLISDDDESILSKQYELVDLHRDNVPLAQYLGDKSELKIYPKQNHIYYPFGCNASQKKAVERALTHQVSIIQGPPGTGKTQTILNIIANLIIERKTVLVVSNNNSAVENVHEKLEHEGLDFMVAKLGCVENKEHFISNQPKYPIMNDWISKEPSLIQSLAFNSLQTVSQCFDEQTQEAQLKEEYDELLKESKYNEMLGNDITDYKWLFQSKSSKLIKILNLYQRIVEKGKKPNILFRLKYAFKIGIKAFSFFNRKPADVISTLESAYYTARKSEIENDLTAINTHLKDIDIQQKLTVLRSSSLQLLKHTVAQRYNHAQRQEFTLPEIKGKSCQFLKEYPIVLSTTYSAKSCINKDMVFDYVIMDEASQVDIKTGALALSCANNAVIVGDDKQLPNVITTEENKALNAIYSTFNVDDKYNPITHSFLQSCIDIFRNAPITLLREHYRCHPLIIGFCNKRFYDGELITMTSNESEENTLQVIRTVKGNHARKHFNQREIDVITQEVLPSYKDSESIGIITPYRLQALEINKTLKKDIARTVHKYQGRECDTIIMSMADNTPTEFSDDPNLLNVAISRAKKHLCIVTNNNEIDKDSNLGQLIAYIQYNNFEIKESKLHSVFDLLYKQHTEERLQYENEHPSISEYLSENLIYDELRKAIDKLRWSNIDIICHYPLSRLIANWDLLDSQEKAFATSPFSHVDFLIYNSLTKRPRLTIEVDGWHFHKENETQQSRDILKDQILTKYGLCPKRITTTETVNTETIIKLLENSLVV